MERQLLTAMCLSVQAYRARLPVDFYHAMEDSIVLTTNLRSAVFLALLLSPVPVGFLVEEP